MSFCRVSGSGVPASASNSNCFSIRIDIALVLSVITRHKSSSVSCELRTATLTLYIARRPFCGGKAKNCLMAFLGGERSHLDPQSDSRMPSSPHQVAPVEAITAGQQAGEQRRQPYAARRAPRRLAAYGSTNMYRPLNIMRKSGGSGE